MKLRAWWSKIKPHSQRDSGLSSWHGYHCEWHFDGHWCRREKNHDGRIHPCFCGQRSWVA